MMVDPLEPWLKRYKMILLIIGCHRSGTSALAGLLNIYGASLGAGPMLSIEEENPQGYWEPERIVRLNNYLLGKLGHKIHYPEPLAGDWLNKDEVKDIERKLMEVLVEDFDLKKLSVIKDPRITILYPLWKRVLESLDVNYGLIKIYRNPKDIESSLIKWRGLTLPASEHMVNFYITQMEYISHSRECKVQHEDVIKNPTIIARQIEIDLNIHLDIKGNEDKARSFIRVTR